MLGLKAGGETPDCFLKLEFLGSKSGLYAGKANTSLSSAGPRLLTLAGKQKQPGLTNQPIRPLCLRMCIQSGVTQANVGDEFLKQPFLSSGSVDRLIKWRKGNGLRGGGLVGVRSEGMECERRRVPPSRQASAEPGRKHGAEQYRSRSVLPPSGAAGDCREG